MASKSNDPLLESLMQLAATAAPLIRKARDAGLFRPMDARSEAPVDAEVVTPAAPAASTGTPASDAQIAALHDIIVRQALQIRALEAEVAALKAATPPA
jgi:hypothetical protein